MRAPKEEVLPTSSHSRATMTTRREGPGFPHPETTPAPLFYLSIRPLTRNTTIPSLKFVDPMKSWRHSDSRVNSPGLALTQFYFVCFLPAAADKAGTIEQRLFPCYPCYYSRILIKHVSQTCNQRVRLLFSTMSWDLHSN